MFSSAQSSRQSSFDPTPFQFTIINNKNFSAKSSVGNFLFQWKMGKLVENRRRRITISHVKSKFIPLKIISMTSNGYFILSPRKFSVKMNRKIFYYYRSILYGTSLLLFCTILSFPLLSFMEWEFSFIPIVFPFV